jgi:hypothetical protein
MNDEPAWRDRARAALENYFERRSFPRTMLSLVLIITGLCGFLVSYGLLRLGVDHMWVRYPVAVLAAYGILLGLIRIWVELERPGFDPSEADLQALAKAQPNRLSRSRSHQWLELLDLPEFGDVGDGDLGEGCLVVVFGAVLVASVTGLIVVLTSAPILIAEVFLDVFIVSVLYRHLRIAEKEHWLGTAIRKTWWPALLTALLLAVCGWALEELAPGSRSVGRAIQQIRTGTPPALER